MFRVSYLVRRSAKDPEGLQGCGILAVHLPALQLHVGNSHSCTVLRIRITFMRIWITDPIFHSDKDPDPDPIDADPDPDPNTPFSLIWTQCAPK